MTKPSENSFRYCFPAVLCRSERFCRRENAARKRWQMPVRHFLLYMWKVWKACVTALHNSEQIRKILQTFLFCYPYSSRTLSALQWKSFLLIFVNLTRSFLFRINFPCPFHHISQFLIFSRDISIILSFMRKHTVCTVFNSLICITEISPAFLAQSI